MNTQTIATTIVALAQLAVIAYGIQAARMFLMHWLDKRSEPLFPPATPENLAEDAARKTGESPFYEHDLRHTEVAALRKAGAMTCLMLAAGLVWTGPKLTPKEAADVLRPNQFTASCSDCDGPHVVVVGGSPTDGPFGRLGHSTVLVPTVHEDIHFNSGFYGRGFVGTRRPTLVIGTPNRLPVRR